MLPRLSHVLIAALLLLGVAACSKPDAGKAQLQGLGPAGGECRAAPNGGPPLAAEDEHREAERGIGGTGTIADVPTAMLTTDRGIGGTGILGIVTGFGSICVDGLEVAYDSSVAVDIDGDPARTSQLRVGQVVAVHAAGSASAPRAQSISVQIAAAGRIDSVTSDGGVWRVGGQRVLVTPRVPGMAERKTGDWVAVSGLRRPDGVVVASRVDPSPSDHLSVRGEAWQERGALRLGALVLPDGSAKPGDWVHVVGDYAGGGPHAVSVTPDTTCPNPYRCFAGAVGRLVYQAYVHAADGQVLINGVVLPAVGQASGINADSVAVVTLQRQPDGAFAATGMRAARPIKVVPVPPVPPDSASPAPQDPTQPDGSGEPEAPPASTSGAITGRSNAAAIAVLGPSAKTLAMLSRPVAARP
ncbi:MAG TPA: DUF5666 domain-containing protein [Rhodopila sp.]|uniref:DUF5666 domain-containing protein n=1 Tax=Rhodopila sp. TaxID=2480087 RepID=UPI002CC7C3CF|nr:DUF5666 domain-containing protein [Rhodopila sp.]HVY15770.1 DUF5666 domain-containing protein [Rhodopila sp.]